MHDGNLLVVDEDETIRCMLSHALGLAGYDVVTAASAEEALLLLSENEWMRDALDLMLTDMELPGLSGLELLDELKRRGYAPPAIIMSGMNGRETVSGAVGRHCVGYFPKPFRLHSLLGAIRGFLAGEVRNRTGRDMAAMLETFLAHS